MNDAPLIIPPRPRSLGDGVTVRRALPHPARRAVGPFVFWDHFGPLTIRADHGMVVRAHPHIGLSTLTWLFRGEIVHRDSLGTVQHIRAGEVNWMTAGRGISHSERATAETGQDGQHIEGIQLWVALPVEAEDDAPSFHHFAADELPTVEAGGARWQVVAGVLAGVRSPVPVRSALVLADTTLATGAALALPRPPEEATALYVASGVVEHDGQPLGEGTMLILPDGAPLHVRALDESHLLLLGGPALPEPRHIWWNFVSHDPAKIEAAQADWAARAARFGAVPGETERIELPG